MYVMHLRIYESFNTSVYAQLHNYKEHSMHACQLFHVSWVDGTAAAGGRAISEP